MLILSRHCVEGITPKKTNSLDDELKFSKTMTYRNRNRKLPVNPQAWGFKKITFLGVLLETIFD